VRRVAGTWSRVETGLPLAEYSTWEAIGGTGPDDVYVVGHRNDGRIAHWDGVSWHEELASSTLGWCDEVWAPAQGDVHVQCGNETLHLSGTTWGTAPFGGGGLWGSSADDVYYAPAWGQALMHWDGTKAVKMYPPLLNVHEIWGSSATDVYALQNGAIYRLTP
jgi:hypothetical protein